MNSSTLFIIACVIAFIVIPSLKDRTMSVRKLLIGPVVFVYFFYQSLGSTFPIFLISCGVIVLGAFLGIMMGYLLRRSTTITVDRGRKIITLKGGVFTLYTFLFISVVHWVIGYLKSVQPNFFMQVSIMNQLLLLALALTSCLSIGGNGYLFIKYYLQKN